MPASPHILVVDDEQMVREVVARYLEREGFRVTAVGDGQAAIRALTAAPAPMGGARFAVSLPVVS